MAGQYRAFHNEREIEVVITFLRKNLEGSDLEYVSTLSKAFARLLGFLDGADLPEQKAIMVLLEFLMKDGAEAISHELKAHGRCAFLIAAEIAQEGPPKFNFSLN